MPTVTENFKKLNRKKLGILLQIFFEGALQIAKEPLDWLSSIEMTSHD